MLGENFGDFFETMMDRRRKSKLSNLAPNNRSKMKLQITSWLLASLSSTIFFSPAGAEELQTEGRKK